jgi:hypothetical protein
VILAATTADRVALFAKPGEGWMLAHRFSELLENLVDPVRGGRRLEPVGIDEQINVLREARDEALSLREARAALEHRSIAKLLLDDPQDLGDVVVVLRVLADSHGVSKRAERQPTRASASPPSKPNSKTGCCAPS